MDQFSHESPKSSVSLRQRRAVCQKGSEDPFDLENK